MTCLICQKEGFKNLAGHLSTHELTVEEYRKKTNYEGPIIVPSHARMMAALSNDLWKNSETREKRTEGVRQSYTPELRQLRSEDALEAWNNPEIREKQIEAIKMSWEDPEVQKRRKEAMKEYYTTLKRTPLNELRIKLYERAGSKCEGCEITEEDHLKQFGRGLSLHHKNYDKLVPDLEDVLLFCNRCHTTLHGDGRFKERFPAVARAIGDLLFALKVDLEDENYANTPYRVARYFLEHFMAPGEFEEKLESFREAVFPSEYGGMVILRDIPAYGICPHHLLPIIYDVDVAYIPTTSTIGLSKLARITDTCLKMPLLQETATTLLADSLSDILNTPSVGVFVRGKHQCMSVRGVKQRNAVTTTSSLLGEFFNDAKARAEFLSLSHE